MDQACEFFEFFRQSKAPSTVQWETFFPVAHERYALIQEEVEELHQALNNRDKVEIADALGDTLYVVYGMCVEAGLDIQTIYERIHASNMSKACNTIQEAKETIQWYVDQQKLGSLQDATIIPHQGKYIVKTLQGKILKSKYYTPVVLDDLV